MGLEGIVASVDVDPRWHTRLHCQLDSVLQRLLDAFFFGELRQVFNGEIVNGAFVLVALLLLEEVPLCVALDLRWCPCLYND